MRRWAKHTGIFLVYLLGLSYTIPWSVFRTFYLFVWVKFGFRFVEQIGFQHEPKLPQERQFRSCFINTDHLIFAIDSGVCSTITHVAMKIPLKIRSDFRQNSKYCIGIWLCVCVNGVGETIPSIQTLEISRIRRISVYGCDAIRCSLDT